MTDADPAETANSISGGVQFGPVLQGRDIRAVIHLPSLPSQSLAQLPGQATGFTGRSRDLAMLSELLDPSRQLDAAVVAITGLAGVGKTALAVRTGHVVRQRGWYSGGILFIDLHGYNDQPTQPGQALFSLLVGLGIPVEHIPPTAEERAGLYRSVLARISEPVLVIADNASTEAQVRPLTPGAGPHRILVTSRHTLAGLGARLVDIQELDDADAMGMLDTSLRISRPDDGRIATDPEAAMQLA